MHRETWLGILLTTIATLAVAQDPAAPAPTPRPADAAAPANTADVAPTPTPRAPAAPAEIHEFEIIETPSVRSTQDFPAPPDAAQPPTPRREVRIIDGDTTIWVDEGGDVFELGDVMGQALEFNPEIRAIRAEIQALMVRLEQLEMKTASDVARKRVEIRQLKDKAEKDKAELEKSGKTPKGLPELEAEIAAREIEMKYLIGREPVFGRGDRPFDERTRVMRGDGPLLASIGIRMSDRRDSIESIKDNKLKKVLDSPISISFTNVDINEVLEFIRETHKNPPDDYNYKMNFNVDIAARNLPVEHIDLKDVPVSAVLAALTDVNRDLVFIIRDYGVFVTTRGRALGIPGPSIPDGVPYSSHAAASPTPAPRAVYRDGEHTFERKVEVSKPTAPATAKPAPHN